MAKRLEESLYRSAKSFPEYNDTSTLKQRLQQLAVNIGMKTKLMAQKHQQAQQLQQGQPQQQQQVQQQLQQQPLQQQQVQVQQVQQQQQQQQQPQYQQQQPHAGAATATATAAISTTTATRTTSATAATIPSAAAAAAIPTSTTATSATVPTAATTTNASANAAHATQQQQPMMHQPAPVPPPQQLVPATLHQNVSQQQQRMVNMSDINPIMGQQAQHMQVQQHPPQQQPQQVQMQYQQPAAVQAPVQQPALSAQPVVGDVNGNNARQVSDRQQVLRHQQQRLLLLRHAAKCQHEDGRCPVTPHCAGMKRLWKHIAECKDQKCLVPHCVSSRYVLSHYHRCKDVRCPVCGPVREAIHRSHEKQKQMQALKQRHQQAIQQNQQAPTASTTAPPLPQPSVPVPATSEPANKRRKIGPGVPAPVLVPGPVPVAPFNQQRPAAVVQPPAQRPLAPPAPVGPGGLAQRVNINAGYAHSNPGVVRSGQQQAAPGVPGVPGVAYANGQVIMPKHTGPKPREDHTLINCFSIDQIETHLASLNKGLQLQPLKLKQKCLDVLKILQSHQHGWVFNSPVDPVELGLPDYFEVIKRPMDLGTIKKRLENGCYHSLDDFEAHCHLTFDNAMTYNPEGSVVYNMANEMKEKFTSEYANLILELTAEEDAKRKNGEACSLCGCEKLLFEPPVFYCNGMNCPSKRIRRNSYYYIGANNQYHWCHQCYQELKDNQQLDLGEVTMRKEELTKKKNDEVHEESWVQCDKCERWIHQICALFNTRLNKDQRSEYTCPRCTIDERKAKGETEGSSTTPMAEDLQRTKLSELLESHVRKKVDAYFENEAKAKAAADGIPLEEAKKGLQMGGEITIRQVTSMDRKLEVRERMKKRYAFKNYPDEFTFRCKCIVVFQNLDGVDVVLFGLYVYEHDEKNPAPNTRTVYISYLDSVYYMRPRKMRTLIYHEILISYLDYVRRKGFATAHIWACPPLKGDDYILYAKPEDQKTPKDDRLRQWYIDMLVDCQKRGIVGLVTNMYDLYFAVEKNDASVVPYMDGDYFPAEVENIIKDIEEGKGGKKGSGAGKKKKNAAAQKQKKKSGRGGTRSTGIDEEALAASGIIPPGMEQKSLEEGGRDYVMVRLGETIQPMKESFIVAHLAWSGATEEHMVVPKEIQDYRDQHGITWRLPESTTQSADQKCNEDSSLPAATTSMAEQAAASTTVPEGAKPAVPTLPAVPSDGNATGPTSDSAPAQSSAQLSIREGKFAAMAARKRDLDGNSKPPETVSSIGTVGTENDDKKDKEDKNRETVKDSKGRLVTVLDDDVEELDCEFLNNRQAFLNLCQGNHYQFDQLRRAKHSSMMVLWHLHNRDAPKFVQQCAICSREILQGYRYHCPTCADHDQCHDCYSNPNTPRHPHPLKPIAVASQQQNELTAAQRKERQRSIQLHMTLLLHAATCHSPKCPSANCTKMKGLLKHGNQCLVKAAGGCHVCKRIWALLQLHARQCKASSCPVPNCMAIRERFRQLKKQQQAMDDRRRQEMNRTYRAVR